MSIINISLHNFLDLNINYQTEIITQMLLLNIQLYFRNKTFVIIGLIFSIVNI